MDKQLNSLHIGQVVQLNSGGSPMTVVNFEYHTKVSLVGVSVGGLVQEVMVDRAAVKPYHGKPTPSGRTGP